MDEARSAFALKKEVGLKRYQKQSPPKKSHGKRKEMILNNKKRLIINTGEQLELFKHTDDCIFPVRTLINKWSRQHEVSHTATEDDVSERFSNHVPPSEASGGKKMEADKMKGRNEELNEKSVDSEVNYFVLLL